MKAVISNRIILNVDKELKDKIVTELTYRIEQKFNRTAAGPEIIRTYSRIKDNIFSVPSGRMDLIPPDYEIIDKRTLVPVEFPKFKFTLRESQQYVHDSVVDSALINAPVSWGKTFTGIAIAAKLGQKTLVLTHTTMLRDQWIMDIDNCLGIKAGIIGSGKWDLDSQIVVANVQTATKRVADLATLFGTVIVDECLDYETLIHTQERGITKLGTIVNQKLPVHVRSFDLESGKEVYKKVVNWYKNPQTECLRIRHAAGSLKATSNHSFYIESNGAIIKRRAGDLKIGDRLILTKNAHKSNLELSSSALPIILGLTLGDGSIALDNKKTNSVRLRITHGEDQLDYLLYKEKLLSGIVTQNIVEGLSGYGNKYTYSFSTNSFIDTFNLRGQLYGTKTSKNQVTEYLASLLTEESWAFIFQDDGSNTGDNISFSFCELDKASIELLGNSLVKLGLCNEWYIYTCAKGYNYLRLNADNSRLFQRRIAKHIHPCIRYKLTIADPEPFKELDFSISDHVKDYYTREILEISHDTLTGNNRFNIEVEDTHTYFANNVLVSNCHHIPATTFNNILDKCTARYKIGLSGTLERKDKKHVIFNDFFGYNVFKPEAENCMVPEIVIYKTDQVIPGGVHWSNRITELENHTPDYRKLVTELADSAANMGHKVLIVASRVDLLEWCAENSVHPAVVISGRVAELAERRLKLDAIANGEADLLYGTCSIFAEGISENSLSCLILATPINNDPMLTQLIGRIVRLKEGKLQPLVIDINLKGSQAVSQARNRYSHYLRKGYKIRVIDKSS